MNHRINHLAVWILVVVHQLVGFGWYAIFGNMWLNLHAKTMTDIELPSLPSLRFMSYDFVPYEIAIIASMFVNYALAWLIARLDAPSAVCGLKIALLCWFSFLFVEYATISVFSAFETNPWPLILINMGRLFVAFGISGLVLGAWPKKGEAVPA